MGATQSAEDPFDDNFAVLLKRLRASSGLTQEELAQAASLSPRTVSDLERGLHPTAQKSTAGLLADALGLAGRVRSMFIAAARGHGPAAGVLAASQREQPGGSTPAVTRALPRDTADFTGREPELAQIGQALTSMTAGGGVVGVCVISGMAGVGKTTFAVHAAHQLAGSFPDGQIFVSLHAHTPGQQPVEASGALASLLLTAGLTASQIPHGLDERSRLWRDHLAGKRLLLVLDDAAGHEQIRPLLPGAAGCLVLITTRKHMTALDDARTIGLATLPAGDAADLFARLAARPGLAPGDDAAGKIIRLCGYLPLAIAMLARQLHHHPAWTGDDLATDLAAARDRLELMYTENLSVAAAFELSYHDLAPDQQRLFRLLGLHPGADIDIHAAAALDGSSLGDARRRLSALYDQHLIGEPARGRYRLHDLMREYARTLADSVTEAERVAATGRLFTYYLRTAKAADRHLARRSPTVASAGEPPTAHEPRLTSRADALSWMAGERLNLHALADQAALHGQPGQALALSSAMHAFLRFAGHWDQAFTLHAAAVRLAVQAHDRRAQAGALADLGDIQLAMRDYPAAEDTLTRAVRLFGDLDDRLGEASALTVLSSARYLTADLSAASAYLIRALDLYRGRNDQFGEAMVLSRLGSVQLVAGDYPAAAEGLARSLKLYRDLGDRLGEAHALNELGAVQQASGQHSQAIASLEQALDLYRGLGDRLGEANALSDLSTARWAAGDDQAAMTGLDRALELYRGLGDRHGTANALSQLGALQRATADYAAATASQEEALILYRDLGDRAGEAEVLIDMGELALASAEPAGALARFAPAQALAAGIAAPLVEARALEGIGRCHVLTGQSGPAATALRRALELYERLGSPAAEPLQQLLSSLDR